MEIESRLIPIMREGIDIIKMVFFKKLKAHLSKKYPEKETTYIAKLTGAIINDLFGTPNTEAPYAEFANENKVLIEEEIGNIAAALPELRIPLTDALRVQFLCDAQDGIDSKSVLSRARDLQILIVDREVPLPAQFISLARKLGNTLGILLPLSQAQNRP